MATAGDEKGPSLKKRLDRLESELKSLHEKIIQRRIKKLQSSYASNESITLESSKPFQCLPRYGLRNQNDEGKEWYSCLKSITRSIAQGSDAIRRIASLTDITSMNETLSSLMPYTTDQETFGSKPVQRGQIDKELIAYHVNAGLGSNVSKGLTISRSDAGISQSRNTRMPGLHHKSLHECKKNLLQENKYLKEQISLSKGLYEELEELRKKLKEETRKRQFAERKATDALKTTNSGDAKDKSYGNKPNTSSSISEKREEQITYADSPKENPIKASDRLVREKTSEELPVESRRSLIEKKYVEEREKRIELEGIVSQFRENLSNKTRECAHVSVGQKLALALAEQFRAKYERDSRRNSSDEETNLMKALKESNKECMKLKEEIARLNNNQELNDNNVYKERALKAENEIELLQQRLEQHSNHRNPLETTVVQSVLGKHKQAYSELILAKKCSEAEYKARCRRLEGEVARLHAYYEKRITTLNDRIRELMLQLQEKIICIDSITNSRDNNDIMALKKTVSEMNVEARRRDAEIGALNAVIADKDNYAKVIEKQKEEALEKLNDIQRNVGELQFELENKNVEISRLLEKIQEKSEEISIKEKLLMDHTDTVTTLRKTLNEIKNGNDSREELVGQLMALKEQNAHLMENVNEMAQTIFETEKFREGQEKNMFLLQELEKQVYDRQKEWEQQLFTMSKEKDHAIQTAKFATQKLVSAVGEYESQLKAHKQLQHLLKASLQEKDHKLEQAMNELQRKNREAALAEENVEIMKNNFQKKFTDVCKVCTDVIDQYPDMGSDYS